MTRLLNSLDKAHYDHPAKLIISIDGGGSQEVRNCAEQFVWQHGEKELIVHEKNLGLRNHILSCGDLTSIYGSAIILEDDLLVSPWYYRYASLAMQFYMNEPKVAGISLNALNLNFLASTPFIPMQDKYDTFFIQLASAWGQLWTEGQWQSFRDWYDKAYEDFSTHLMPEPIKNWPNTSWVKYYTRYLVEKSKYFVWPRFSLSTNLTEPGENFHQTAPFYQSILLFGEKSFEFKQLDESAIIYDSYLEIDKQTMDYYVPSLREYDYVVDLNGLKPLQNYKNQFVLTVRACKQHIKSYAAKLVPFEMNLVQKIQGEDISLASKDLVILSKGNSLNAIRYHYSFIPIRELLKLLWGRISRRS